jgi:hypothetical protein
MMLKEYRHGLQTRASRCGYVRLGLAGHLELQIKRVLRTQTDDHHKH